MLALVTCEDCGREFPEDSEGSGTQCGGCYVEEHCFGCAWCEAYGDVADQHAYVVVFDAWEVGVQLPGLYRVTGVPYYSQSMLGGGMLFRSCIEWVGFLPAMEDDGCPCGHLCKDCQDRAVAWIAEDRARGGMLAALR
jgi:hypothetical protein